MNKATFYNLLILISLLLPLPLLGMLQVSLLEKDSCSIPLLNKLFGDKQDVLILGYTQDTELEKKHGTIPVVGTYIYPEYEKGSFVCSIISQNNTIKNNELTKLIGSQLITLNEHNHSCKPLEGVKHLALVDNELFQYVVQLLLNKGYSQKVSSPKLTRHNMQGDKETFQTGTAFFDAWSQFIEE